MKLRCLFAAKLGLWLAAAIAQEPRFIQHDLGDANSGMTILAMLQDRNCMLWLGTEQGLARFDGVNYRPVELPGTATGLQVTSLAEDHLRHIWVGTSSGEIFYLDETRMVHAFQPQEGHPQKPITGIAEDPAGQIWFATYGEGVYVYSGSRLFNFNLDDGLSGNDIYAMEITPDGEVWLGTDDGITVCSFDKETKHVKKLGLQEGLPDQIITALKADSSGNIYIGTFESGVVLYDTQRKRITPLLQAPMQDEITALELFDGRELWIGTVSHGVWRYRKEWNEPRHLNNLQAFHISRITDLLSDVEGNIWITFNEGGLVSAFRPFESLACEVGDIQAVFVDQRDQVWIGAKNGLYRLVNHNSGPAQMVRVAPRYPLNVTDLLEDQYHQIWIGTLDKGLFVYDPDRDRIVEIGSIFDKGGITIMSMAMSSAEIWIATLEGVVSFPAGKNILSEPKEPFTLLKDPWQSNLHFVFQVYVDSKDRTWFATDGNGAFCVKGSRVMHFAGTDSLRLRKVYSVCEDHRGHLWFNTPDLGLVEFDGSAYKQLQVADGLGNLNIASLWPAGTGDIVMAHTKGIDVMEPDRRHFMYYAEEIGAKKIEPGLNAIAADRDHNVYVGCRDVLFKYFATRKKLSIHPRTQLTKVSVFEQPIDFASRHSFSHAQNYFTFDYVGLWYTSPSSVKYLYILEGYDLQWKESKDNVASYAHLGPGTYTFRVKASENNFFLDEPLASYSFTIGKPFWLQYWFISLATLSAGGLLFWIIKAREKRSERQALLQKEMLESQLAALKAQINPHFLFNSFNTLITLIDENAMQPEVAIEYVEKLSDFYRSILQYREQEFITVEEEFEVVRSFTYLLEKRYGQHLRLHMDSPPSDGYILPLTLQILVENAVKHNIISEQYPLDVYITVDKDQYITVRNSLQPKLKPEPSTQFGLQSIIKQYQLLSDRKVIVHQGQHQFEVRIPVIKRA